jgi:hypothetical protein
MKLIKQEHKFGCGIACIASILNIKYKNALRLFKNGEKRAEKIPDFYCKEMIWILKNQGLNYEYKYVKNKIKKRIYQPNSIVFIKRTKKYKYGHYLIRINSRWMDPWINLPDKNIRAGYRKRLPAKPIYVLFAIQ